QWETFLDRLINSNREILRLTGKVERLVWRWYRVDRRTLPAQIAELKSETDGLAKEISKFPREQLGGRTTSFGGGDVRTLFEKVSWQIERASYSFDPFIPRRRLEAARPKPTPRAKLAGAERPYESGRISLQELPFTIPIGAGWS